MFSLKRNDGFTLFEVIIAVALVAIMAVAIVPPLLKNINEGKVARAQSDAQVIATGILGFYKDTGDWPLDNNGNPGADLTRLASNAILGGGNAGIPAGAAGISGGGNWDSYGTAGTLNDALVRNATDTVDPIYTESKNPHIRPGWNGPYLDSVPLDPWGNPFVVNLRYTNTAVGNYERHAVLVVSAGPNQLFETTFDDGSYEEVIGGDDIGYLIRPAEQN